MRVSTWMRLVAADPLELALLQRPQEFRLQFEVDSADFIEEQRAQVGQLEPAGFLFVRARERTLLVAEQFGSRAGPRITPRSLS